MGEEENMINCKNIKGTKTIKARMPISPQNHVIEFSELRMVDFNHIDYPFDWFNSPKSKYSTGKPREQYASLM